MYRFIRHEIKKKIKNLNDFYFIYWVSLNRVLKLFNKVYMFTMKPVFHECRALLDIIITVQKVT